MKKAPSVIRPTSGAGGGVKAPVSNTKNIHPIKGPAATHNIPAGKKR